MGNVELCGGPSSQDLVGICLVGHIKNSQTRGLMTILEASKIRYNLESIELPKTEKNVNTQGLQG